MGFSARWVGGLGLALLLTAPARGQPSDVGSGAAPPQPAPTSAAPAPLPPSTPSDSLSPERLMAGPSLHETGRIAVSPVPMPTTAIENQDAQVSPKEKSISGAASTINTAPIGPHGVINPRILDREVADHFNEIAACRVEVARAKQIKPPEVVADQILLRWTIERDGSIGSTEIVAVTPVDLGIMDCAKRVMSQWTFSRPRGGTLAVERRFTFASSVPGER